MKHGVKAKSTFNVTPGSEQIRATIERDGIVSAAQLLSILIMSADVLLRTVVVRSRNVGNVCPVRDNLDKDVIDGLHRYIKFTLYSVNSLLFCVSLQC